MQSRSLALRAQVEAALADRVPAALSPQPKAAPELARTGIAAVDRLCGGGIPRGGLTEICGPESSGRTTVLLSLLKQMTSGGEVCALVDAGDSFDPQSGADAGVEFGRLLWVRCNRHSGGRGAGKGRPGRNPDYALLEQALKSTDLLLQSGGFGLIAVDLGSIDPKAARRVPLTSWFRFRRAVEKTPTALVVLEEEAHARTCASLVVNLAINEARWEASPGAGRAHAGVLSGMEITVDVGRSREMQRKPAQGTSRFTTRTRWAV